MNCVDVKSSMRIGSEKSDDTSFNLTRKRSSRSSHDMTEKLFQSSHRLIQIVAELMDRQPIVSSRTLIQQ